VGNQLDPPYSWSPEPELKHHHKAHKSQTVYQQAPAMAPERCSSSRKQSCFLAARLTGSYFNSWFQ